MERDLHAVFGEEAMKERKIRKWAERFREGRDSVSKTIKEAEDL